MKTRYNKAIIFSIHMKFIYFIILMLFSLAITQNTKKNKIQFNKNAIKNNNNASDHNAIQDENSSLISAFQSTWAKIYICNSYVNDNIGKVFLHILDQNMVMILPLAQQIILANNIKNNADNTKNNTSQENEIFKQQNPEYQSTPNYIDNTRKN